MGLMTFFSALTGMTHSIDTEGMANVQIPNVPDWVVEACRARAPKGGHSLEEELRGLLTEGALHGRKVFVRRARAFQDSFRRRYCEMPTAEQVTQSR